MLLFVFTTYDGLPSIILQPFIACIPAIVFALLAELTGVPLRATRLKAPWERLGRGAYALAGIGAGMILLAGTIGVAHVVEGGVGERAREVLPVPYSAGAFFLCVFPFVNARAVLSE